MAKKCDKKYNSFVFLAPLSLQTAVIRLPCFTCLGIIVFNKLVIILCIVFIQRDLGEIPEVERCEPMQLNEWQSFLDDVGRVTNVKKLHDRIFRGVCAHICETFLLNPS